MRKTGIAFILLLLATALSAADRATEVRNAETAFAKAFEDRDQAKFFSFVADDATFLGAKQTMAGKAEIIKVWSQYFKSEKAPFAWTPERVAVNGSGDIGETWGPVHDAQGKLTGHFQSVWQRQADGSWKVLFDGPGAPACETTK